jgi:hypothetical protein
MDGTTAIKIDYYEELKAKADKYDDAKIIIDFTNSILYSNEEKYSILPILRYSAFEKLREKSDKWDEREKGVLIEWDGGMYLPICKHCGFDSVQYEEKYCSNCGIKLNWSESED